MIIILKENDIKELINSKYKGIKAIDFNNSAIEINLTVDIEEFLNSNKTKIQPTNTTINNPNIPIKMSKPENKLESEIKKGTMASGGKERIMARF